ncbi:peroxidase-like [Artemia franciscana]|uniref:peroxidase-like n=1 Tax=Artemia franciscana TaxID=6661 RepID=UPI0032DA6D0B
MEFSYWILKTIGLFVVAIGTLTEAQYLSSKYNSKAFAPYAQRQAKEPPSCPSLAYLPSSCKPASQCSVWYKELNTNSKCGNYYDWKLCCPDVRESYVYAYLFEEQTLESELHELPRYEVDYVSEYGPSELKKMAAIEANLIDHKVYLNKENPAYRHYTMLRASDDAVIAGEKGLMVTKATQLLKKRLNLSNDMAGKVTQTVKVEGSALANTCLLEPECYYNRYRSADGSCNNLKSPNMGRSLTQMDRILPPDYDDGVWEGRDRYMPNSRLVRVTLAEDYDVMNYDSTLMLMQWGQLIDHDIAHTPVFRMPNNSAIQCCSPYGDYVSKEYKHPHCFVVDILPGDPFYSQYGVKCLNFVRSMVAPRSDCAFGYAEQMNQVTHWIDGSLIYGSSELESRSLREYRGGRLQTSNMHGYEMLPYDEYSSDSCVLADKGKKCYKSGDERVNQIFSLTIMQTCFLRLHNQIVYHLSRLNPHWNDERLYQEGRRIVGAILQHITYNEYLPLILGRDVLEYYGLVPKTYGYTSYNDSVNGNILNEFATAAYRYGHSTVNHWIDLQDEYGRSYERMYLRYYFNYPHILSRSDVYDGTIRGLVKSASQMADQQFTNDLTNYLFKEPSKDWGFDLVAFNVWRGRDHGLPGYNKYRESMGLKKAKTWYDLSDVFTPQTIEKMSKLYRSPDDIDLYMGGMSEKHKLGSLLGPTFVKIIADQFARLKYGDRFYYEHGGLVNSFSPGQLDAIRKVSLSSVLCMTGNKLKSMQPLSFRLPSHMNPVISCKYIPRLDLSSWKE